ncbi:hypothetical protein mRhiFer1_010193 [Rhinolophus ferrumequinum]|uniref:Uncharacterized protein n=1 Tax=Rhinolophus ferrumequinum TaxID=59479 RepID=A0A7J7XPQ7_RHIFE|nr:hypothetical protein mRhiFer1_010193 [Rhinolophus ferrumequinum]
MRSPGPSRNAPGEGFPGNALRWNCSRGFPVKRAGGDSPLRSFPCGDSQRLGEEGVRETPDARGVQVRPSPSRTTPASAWSPAESKPFHLLASPASAALDLLRSPHPALLAVPSGCCQGDGWDIMPLSSQGSRRKMC